MAMEKKYIRVDELTSSEMPSKNEVKRVKFLARKASTKKEVNRGVWTADEDKRLAQVIAIRGAKKWKIIAAEAGLNRCGKSCRLRWMNYLRPNIKRGNISDQEEDLIIRLHKLLGNRWSLIAGRLPGRTDNEIKNYWNSHLSKKIGQGAKPAGTSAAKEELKPQKLATMDDKEKVTVESEESVAFGNDDKKSSMISFNVDEFFDFSNEGPLISEWMNYFVEQYQVDLYGIS